MKKSQNNSKIVSDVGMAIKMNVKCFKDIYLLDQGKKIDEKQIIDICDFANKRYDCADFRVASIIKTLYSYKHLLSEETIRYMEDTVLNFKYWMDEPGIDGMCYWSENHQILFHTIEYLAGNMFEGVTFSNSNMTGIQHVNKALPKINNWMKNRFLYGFTEWHSNTYYEEDIAALSLLIEFSNDDILVNKATIILDIIMLDMAMLNYNGYFAVTSGRYYELQKKDVRQADVNDILMYMFNIIPKKEFNYERISSVFILNKKYQLPKVIYEIAHYKDAVEIKQSFGLNLNEVKKEIPKGFDNRGMFFWAMEAFTNPESINISIDIFKAWKLQTNNFLKPLKPVSNTIVRRLGLLPNIVKVLNPATQGIAIQRADTYTYKTKDYLISTAQKYHPGEYGDQQHIWNVVLPNNITVFTTHPGAAMFDEAQRNFSPSYWVGNAINPHAVQDKNILLCYYNLDQRKGVLEKNRNMFTHIYFPFNKFNNVVLKNKLCVGEINDSYIGIISLENFEKANDELISRGIRTGYAVILADTNEYKSIEEFVKKLENSNFNLNNDVVTFDYNNNIYSFKFKGDFFINNNVINTNYDLYDSPFVKANRKPNELSIKHGNNILYLNFDKAERRM